MANKKPLPVTAPISAPCPPAQPIAVAQMPQMEMVAASGDLDLPAFMRRRIR
jgi:hypothetical protein